MQVRNMTFQKIATLQRDTFMTTNDDFDNIFRQRCLKQQWMKCTRKVSNVKMTKTRHRSQTIPRHKCYRHTCIHYTHAYRHAYRHTCTDTHIGKCTCLRTFSHTYIHTYTRTYAYIHMCTRSYYKYANTYTRACRCENEYVSACNAHTYKNTCIHAYIQTKIIRKLRTHIHTNKTYRYIYMHAYMPAYILIRTYRHT